MGCLSLEHEIEWNEKFTFGFSIISTIILSSTHMNHETTKETYYLDHGRGHPCHSRKEVHAISSYPDGLQGAKGADQR